MKYLSIVLLLLTAIISLSSCSSDDSLSAWTIEGTAKAQMIEDKTLIVIKDETYLGYYTIGDTVRVYYTNDNWQIANFPPSETIPTPKAVILEIY